MHAAVGDRLVVSSRHIDLTERRGEIVEVQGDDGAPPYVVQWDHDGHRGLFFPGPDVAVRHVEASESGQPDAQG